MISHKDLLICIFNGTIKNSVYVKQNRRDFHKQIKSFSKTRVKLHMGWMFGCRTDGKVSMTNIIIAIRVLEAKLEAKNLENSSVNSQRSEIFTGSSFSSLQSCFHDSAACKIIFILAFFALLFLRSNKIMFLNNNIV